MACDKHQHCWHLFSYSQEANGDRFIVQMCCCCETERLVPEKPAVTPEDIQDIYGP